MLDGRARLAVEHHAAVVDHHHAIAEIEHRDQVVRDEHERNAVRAQRPHPRETLLLKPRVADAQHLVDEQDVRIQMRRDGKTEPRVHARRVAFHRRVDELGYAREFDDLVELPGDLRLLHPHDRALEVEVLATGQIGMEAGRDLDERADTSADLAASARRSQDPGQQLQHRRLAGAVRADDAERVAGAHLEGHVAQRPELARIEGALVHGWSTPQEPPSD